MPPDEWRMDADRSHQGFCATVHGSAKIRQITGVRWLLLVLETGRAGYDAIACCGAESAKRESFRSCTPLFVLVRLLYCCRSPPSDAAAAFGL